MTNKRHTAAGHGLSTLFHADALPQGTMLGEFEVTGLLGVGGFGMVYDAFDHSLQRMVAIKEYMPSALAGRSEGLSLASRSSADKDALSAGLVSFIAEARLLAQFDHPSLVKVYRFWEANNTAYMVMPLYKGLTLKHARTQAQSPPPEAWLRHMLWSVLGALEYLHEHNVVHRDISPENIFLQEAGPPVLLDLGAARRAIGESSHKHTAILKVNYAPIEQYADANDLPQGPWTDLYALAAVVHGSLCNAQPLPATFRVVRDRLPPFASVAKTVESIFGQEYSKQFVHAFSLALEIQPQDRPQSVQAFIKELGLTAPVSPQTMSWRSPPAVGSAAPVVDSEAKTVYQVTRPPVTTIDAPVTDNTPLELVSAYGVLEQESQLLVPQESTSPALAQAIAPVDGAGEAIQVNEKGDAAAPARKVEATNTRSAARTAASVASVAPAATASASLSRVKTAVIATVCGFALLGGAIVWNVKGKRSEMQAAPPPVAAPIAAIPLVSPPSDQASPRKNAVEAAPTPIVASSSPPSSGAAQKPKTPVKPTDDGAAKAVLDARSAAPKSTLPARAPTQAAPPGSGDPRAAAPATTPAVARADTAPAAAAPKATSAKERLGPAEICAEKNFLVRPMCIHTECEKPEFAKLALCVENARRLKEATRPPDR